MTQTDPMQIIAGLTGPGGQWEMEPAEVLGVQVPVFKHRFRALHEVLASTKEYGDRPYVVTLEGTMTYADHASRVASIARVLREEYGVQKGDRVAIAAANGIGWIQVFWATVSIGAVAVGFNAWWSKHELAYGLAHTTPKIVFADAKRLAQLEGVDVTALDIDADVEQMACAHPEAEMPTADVDEDDPAVVLYTSGTSGRPKGAVHSHRNLGAVIEYHKYADALGAAFGDPVPGHEKVHLLVSPLFHIASLHNIVVAKAGTGSVIALHLGAFDPAGVLQLIQEAKVTNWGAVPTMANRLLQFEAIKDYDTSSLSAFSLSAAPSSPEFKQRVRDGLPFASALVDSYGMTETCTAICVATPADLAEAPGSLGRPIVGVEMQIRDVNGEQLPPGEEGEVHTRSCFTMLGYWDNPDATAASFTHDRWLRTGDLGSIDETGRLRLASRRSDLIIRGGENVYPAEIEGALAEHPQVTECVVVGVAHSDLGQEVGAIVVAPGADANKLSEELSDFVAERLAHFKVPTHWRIVETPLPRNATGKVIRTAVSL